MILILWFCLQALCSGSLVSWGFFSPNGAALDHIRSLCQSGMVCIFCFKSFVLWVQIILSNLFYSSWLSGKIQLEACTKANDDLENDTSNVLSQCRLKIQCNFSLNYITIISDAWECHTTYQVFFAVISLKYFASSYCKM